MSLDYFYHCFKSKVDAYLNSLLKSTCEGFAMKVSLSFDDCFISLASTQYLDEGLLKRVLNEVFNYVTGVLEQYKLCSDINQFTSYLYKWSKGLPRSQKLYKYFKERIESVTSTGYSVLHPKSSLRQTSLVLNSLEALRGCLDCSDTSEPYFIKSIGSEYEVIQEIGGTRGTDYIYVYDNDYFTNIKHLPTSNLISKEELGRGRIRETYRISKEVMNGKVLLSIRFTNKGYIHSRVCLVSNDIIKCCYCNPLRDDDELALKIAARFKPISDEYDIVRWYLDITPKLTKEIFNVITKSGAKGIFPLGHAMRLSESLHRPGLSLLTSMVLDTAEGRKRSVYTKLSHILELDIIAKIIDALEGISLTEYWWVEFTTNRPLTIIKSRVTDKEYTIFYQSSILPHILPGFIRGSPKHLVPDIVVFEGRVEDVYWGELYKLIESGRVPELVIEVKTGLKYLEWEQSAYVVEQVREYIGLLRPKNMAVVSLKDIDSSLKMEFKAMGVRVFENIVDEDVQKEFKNYIMRNLST